MLLLEEISERYTAERHGAQPEPRPAPPPYTDFVHWQQDLLAGSEAERLWRYWQEKLAGIPPVLALPTDRPRPPVQTYAGDALSFELDAALTGKLQTLAREEGVTLYAVLLAALQTLFHRYTSQQTVLVGSSVAGRTRSQFANTLGYFANQVIMPADFEGNPTFRTLLNQVGQTVLEALEHQDYPFSRLIEGLRYPRDASRSPGFQVEFTLDRSHRPEFQGGSLFMYAHPRARMEIGGMLLEPYELPQRLAPFDISLLMEEVGGQLYGVFCYNSDLFDAETIRRMADHYWVLLNGAVADPDLSVASLPLLTESERRQVVVTFNETARETPWACLHHLIEARAAQTPDATALIFGEQRLTYRQMDQRANQLAHLLRSLGIGPGNLVGLCLERSLDLILGMLAIWKAGGGYLPLDPTQPRERLAFMLAETRAPLLLTQSHWLESLPDHGGRTVCLDQVWDQVQSLPAEPPEVAVGPDDLAYVIFTSGSTGRPKGVLTTQRGLGNLAEATRRTFGLTGTDRVLQFSPITFDASFWETMMTLTSGAALVLAPREELLPGSGLLDLLRRQAVTVAIFPPSALRVMPDEGLPDLRVVVSAGEACSPELVSRWRRGRRMFNAYGPTEVTVCSTLYEFRDAAGPTPIGRPIDNCQIYLLDAQMEPVPVGLPGEMYIGGIGLAKGYLNRPELTAERFVTNPFSPEPGARLYRSGDLARWLPDGNLEYLGRADNQVKVRGNRIEPGEIEAALREHPTVGDAVVIAREDRPGDLRLVAYLVPAEPGQEEAARPATAEIRTFLGRFLPEYMMPAAFLWLNQIPLTAHGKVDRRALPAPGDVAPSEAYVAPSGRLEQEVARLFQEVLGVARVGVNDNFFDLGGNSLLLVNLQARLEEMLGRAVPITDLFRFPTVSALAVHLGQGEPDSSGSEAGKGRGAARREAMLLRRQAADRVEREGV